MSPHNKRGKSQLSANKEKRAGMFNNKTRNGYVGRARLRHRGNSKTFSPSYLSSHTHRNQNRPTCRTFDAEDPFDRQLFDYIIVVDVEATCEENQRQYPHEIIELPGVLIDVRCGMVDRGRSFCTYVKPRLNPVLTEFCKRLTGISQEDVDSAPDITEAIRLFEKWYTETIPKGAKVAFAADGPWDFEQFIYEHHVLRDHISFPSIFYEYLDIRTTFARLFRRDASMKLDSMLQYMGLEFKGNPHCGFDDAYNIARLALKMMRAGCVFDFLIALPLSDEFFYHLEGYPLYRRKEGSGRVDRDLVDDIAKQCFGSAYFAFGEAHRAATLAYRAKHPSLFQNSKCVMLRQKATRQAWKRRCYCIKVVALLLLGLVFLVGGLKGWLWVHVKAVEL